MNERERDRWFVLKCRTNGEGEAEKTVPSVPQHGIGAGILRRKEVNTGRPCVWKGGSCKARSAQDDIGPTLSGETVVCIGKFLLVMVRISNCKRKGLFFFRGACWTGEAQRLD